MRVKRAPSAIEATMSAPDMMPVSRCTSVWCPTSRATSGSRWNGIEHVLPRLPVIAPSARIGRVALHPTCSSSRLGIDGALRRVAAAVAEEVFVPEDWGCCAFAGDRGMLHPELTASATRAQAAQVRDVGADAHASLNRTCELGMTRATGKPYQHVLELLERATRGDAGTTRVWRVGRRPSPPYRRARSAEAPEAGSSIYR